jgi:hypothetical protein
VEELVNEAASVQRQYFYVDYELYEDVGPIAGQGYLHAEFRRENPCGGWGHEITVNHPEADIVNAERLAWDNNYVILETRGRGHYIGCNLSITNFQGTWWGEGDDMIWIDGYKWPPDLHGTGSEDYLNQAWGMQRNAFLRSGSSIFERDTGGYQTSYVFHLENPVRFEREIKVTIEHGHGNHLANEVSSVAYWYAESPSGVATVPPLPKRLRVPKTGTEWAPTPDGQVTSRLVPLNDEMRYMKKVWKACDFPEHFRGTGRLIAGDDEVIFEMPLSRDNPNRYPIPLEEILEPFIGSAVILSVMGDPHQGTLRLVNDGLVLESDAGTLPLRALLTSAHQKEVMMEVILALPDEDGGNPPAAYEIILQPPLSE